MAVKQNAWEKAHVRTASIKDRNSLFYLQFLAQQVMHIFIFNVGLAHYEARPFPALQPRFLIPFQDTELMMECFIFVLVAFSLMQLYYDTAMLTTAVLTGCDFYPLHNAPYFATSLRDFWSHRWNLPIKSCLHHFVFAPVLRSLQCLKKRDSNQRNHRINAVIATMAVFIFSGIMHEFNVVNALLGVWPHGSNMRFFLLNGLLCVGQEMVQAWTGFGRTWGRGANIPVTASLLLSMSPFFIAPYTKVIQHKFIFRSDGVISFILTKLNLKNSTKHVSLLLALAHLESEGVNLEETGLTARFAASIKEAVDQVSCLDDRLSQMSISANEERESNSKDVSSMLPFSLAAVVEFFLSSKSAPVSSDNAPSIHSSRLQFERCESLSPKETALIPTAGSVLSVAESPSLDTIVASVSNKQLIFRNRSTGEVEHMTVQSPVLSLAVHPVHGNWVAAAAMDGTCVIVDALEKRVIQSFKHHSKYVSRVAFSKSGAFMVTAGYDWAVTVYALDEGSNFVQIHSMTFLGAIESLVFLPARLGTRLGMDSQEPADETFVVGCRNDSALHFVSFNPANGTASTEPTHHSRHSMNLNGDDWVSFTPMDMCVTVQEGVGLLAVYTDMPSGRVCFYTVNQIPRVDAISPFLVEFVGDCFGVVADAFSRPKCVFVWKDTFDSTKGTNSPKRALLLAATSDDNKVVLFDVGTVFSTQAGSASFKLGGASDFHAPLARKVGECLGHEGLVRALCVSLVDTGGVSGTILYTGSFDKSLRVWNV
ncbi:long-chain-alcohol O-fatty-acyltransferase [Chytriomyces confervae]|uniref:Long-chain-alcohol O-fatty-acyltransferase n=1 Tax=Chytriomyces confervae TaxID=246404 RepID=A0A507F0C0_9FUNG|nr:long-chain-alcohol O-fatty-acyltransferase [Chytriomyces confervae]